MKEIHYGKYILIFMFILLSICLYSTKTLAANQLEGIANFPVSYQAYLNELAKKHPNWQFTALYTGLDWNYVIDQENVFGKNLVPKNYSDS